MANETPRRGVDDGTAAGSSGEYLLPEQHETPELGARRKRRNRTAGAVVAGVLGVILLGLAVVIGFYVKSASDALDQVQRQPSMLPSDYANRPPSPSPEKGENASMNVLIMGTDSRGAGDQGRSDVMILAHVSGDRKSVYLISFPRDMWVEVPGHGMAKINAAYAWGGMPLAVQTVESLTGARIEHSALVDFEGFVAIIDAVGGVEVNNFAASGSGGYIFPVGPVQLDGKSGLVYTRERYNLPNGDLDRARRQRDVALAVVKKVVTPDVLADPARFNDVVSTMAPYFSVDEGFTAGEMTKLALSMRVTDTDALRSLQAPIQGFGTSDDGQSIDIVSAQFMAELAEAMQTDTMATYWENHKSDPPVGTR